MSDYCISRLHGTHWRNEACKGNGDHMHMIRADLHDSRVKALEARIAALIEAGDALLDVHVVSCAHGIGFIADQSKLLCKKCLARKAWTAAKSLETKGG